MSAPSEAAARAASGRHEKPTQEASDDPACDICGAADVRWIRCKLICQRCGTILLSCSDL